MFSSWNCTRDVQAINLKVIFRSCFPPPLTESVSRTRSCTIHFRIPIWSPHFICCLIGVLGYFPETGSIPISCCVDGRRANSTDQRFAQRSYFIFPLPKTCNIEIDTTILLWHSADSCIPIERRRPETKDPTGFSYFMRH